MTTELQLTRGQVARIDDCDLEWLSQWSWSAGFYPSYAGGGKFLAVRGMRIQKRQTMILMHRFVLSAELKRELVKGELVDHIDGNPLNNTRNNLRLASKSQNSIHSALHSRNKSGYRGVFWDRRSGKWRASIVCEGKTHELGRFSDVIEGAQAYDAASSSMFGEFAYLNLAQGSGEVRGRREHGTVEKSYEVNP